MASLENLVIGMVIISGVIIGTSAFIGGIAAQYPTNFGNATTDFAYMSQLNSTMDTANEIQDTVKGSSVQSSDVVYIITTGAYNGIKLIFQSVDTSSSLVRDTSELVGLPEWVPAVVIGIIVLIVIFAFLTYIFRVKA
jgi:hypothetical protein